MLKKKGWNSPDMFKMVLAIFFLVVFALLCFFFFFVVVETFGEKSYRLSCLPSARNDMAENMKH